MKFSKEICHTLIAYCTIGTINFEFLNLHIHNLIISKQNCVNLLAKKIFMLKIEFKYFIIMIADCMSPKIRMGSL